MSDQASKTEAVKNIANTLNQLRQNKPKVFYGAIGALFILFLFLVFGGETGQSPEVQAALQVGEQYRLVNPNGGEVLLVAVPGQFSSAEYDKDDSQNICLVTSATPVKLEEETFLNYIHYVKVRVIEGPCKDKSGWTSKVNIKK